MSREIRAKARRGALTEDQKADLLSEVKRLLTENGITAKIEADVGKAKSCPVCIACTCMVCV